MEIHDFKFANLLLVVAAAVADAWQIWQIQTRRLHFAITPGKTKENNIGCRTQGVSNLKDKDKKGISKLCMIRSTKKYQALKVSIVNGSKGYQYKG